MISSHLADQHDTNHSKYVGRFAPSPTGPLHFGSLVCALASFLHAKQAQGKWLVRIEDIDTPRVDTSMTPKILDTLAAHGLYWDDTPIRQSERSEFYERYLQKLANINTLYGCRCTRKQIKARAAFYDRYCADLHLPFEGSAIRWMNNKRASTFTDNHYGPLNVNHHITIEDPVLKRADGIYAYHLAVLTDDIEQGVNHIVRGADLIDMTPLHLSLYEALEQRAPAYLHVPIAVDESGQKLSKQQRAQALDNACAVKNLKSALVFLGVTQNALPSITSVSQLIDWSIQNWQVAHMSTAREILVSQKNGVYSIA